MAPAVEKKKHKTSYEKNKKKKLENVAIRRSERLKLKRANFATVNKEETIINVDISSISSSSSDSIYQDVIDEETMANEQLNQLIELLKLKEERESGVEKISAEQFGKIIPEYDGKAIPIKKWIENFEKNAEAYGLKENQKFVQARAKMQGAAKLFLESASVSNYAELKTALIEEFTVTFSSVEIHKKLADRKKKENEDFHEYMLHMKKIAALGDVDEISVIRYIVDGLKLKSEQKLLLYRCKTYKELKSEYEICERINSSEKTKEQTAKVVSANKINKEKKEHCYNCGSAEHKRKDCKATTKCFQCNGLNHIAKNCPSAEKRNESAKANKYEKNNATNDTKKSESAINVVNLSDRGDKKLKEISINSNKIQCLVDGGADVSVIEVSLAKRMNVRIEQCENKVSGYGNKESSVIGMCEVELEIDSLKCKHKFIVAPDNMSKYDAILGFDFIGKCKFNFDENGYIFTNFISDNCNNWIMQIAVENKQYDVPKKFEAEIEKIIENYTPEKETLSPINMKIVLNEEKIVRHMPRRLPVSEQKIVSEQVDKWLEQNIIRPSNSEYSSRVVLADKKDGEKRVCVDYRDINKIVQKDIFPIPLMEEVVEALEGAKVFTTLDLENAFFHVPVEENSKKFTAFITKDGVYEFNRAPFGFCNSPAVFLRYINHIFHPLIRANIIQMYMDDIIVYSTDEDENIDKIRMVLKEAERNGLKFKWKKCKFLQKEVVYLGLLIKNGCISPDVEKCEAIRRFPVPENIKKLQSFLGLTGYFRKFVKDYAILTKPLSDMLRKNSEFNIGPKELAAIENVKNALIQQPVLRIFSQNAATELHTDACKDGFGAILLQEFEGKLHPVYYWSKKCTPEESRLHSYYLEVKAAYLAVQKLHHYLMGREFKLVTDCQAFKSTTSKKDLSPAVTRWILHLQNYQYTIQHRSGTAMRHVDALSRSPINIMTISDEFSARLRKAQENDEHLKAIKIILSTQPYEDYVNKNNILFKYKDGLTLFVVPRSMENEIIRLEHEKGHFAVEKTINAVEQKFFVPHLRQKVEKIIHNCVKCILYNKKLGKQEGHLHVIDKGDAPLCTVHVDHLGPMDATTKKYKYIFAIIDGFSKFVWLFPTKTTAADEVIKKFSEWSNIFGAPQRIISDKGAAFMSTAFKEWCQQESVEHILATTGVARSNGQVERLNRIIINVISKLSADHPEKWYKYVPKLQRTINSTISKSTKVTPFELMFGVKMRTELDVNINKMVANEMAEIFLSQRDELRAQAKKQIFNAQKAYKQQYDKHRKNATTYKVGDLVAIKRTQFVSGKKLANGYLGPYKVTKCKRNDRYEVKKAANFEGPINTSTSCDFMKPWKSEEDDQSGSDNDESNGRM